MTVLCLCNNISRHIKVMSMILNFVTEICGHTNLKNKVLDVLIKFQRSYGKMKQSLTLK